jgi:DNA-binding response OmpR family regulator
MPLISMPPLHDKVVMKSKVKILIVDDNVDAADMTAQVLEALGFEVTTTYDGLSAIPMAKMVKPDVILLDLVLPEANGFVLARLLRNESSTKPQSIFLVTAFDNPTYRRIAQESGIDRYFVKPLNFDELQACIAQ